MERMRELGYMWGVLTVQTVPIRGSLGDVGNSSTSLRFLQ